MTLLLTVTQVTAFFDYNTDCPETCRLQELPCTIMELNPHLFPSACINSLTACIEMASPDRVCLSPKSKPKGGSAIWIAYWNYTHPIPPTPPPDRKTNFLLIYAIIVTVVLVVYCGATLIYCMTQSWRRRSYQRLDARPENEQAERAPYEPTTIDL